MTNKQMMSIADEAGVISASDYQDLKNRLAFERARRLEMVKNDPELASMILSLAGELMAAKRQPENMKRDPEKMRAASKLGAAKRTANKLKRVQEMKGVTE